jgi:hyperpolarization activated cyclic nucleotide-gated potassium channel 1
MTNKFNSNLTRVIGFFISISLFIHISGCIWFYVSNLGETEKFTWIDKQNISDKDDVEIYLTCIYFVFTTFTTVGYGDITPVSNSEKIFTIVMMAFGAWIYSYMIGAMSSTIKSRDQAKSILKAKKKFLKDFSKAIDLPLDLTLKVKNYLNMSAYKFQTENVHFWGIFKDLPANLRESIKTHSNQNLARCMKFFNDKPTSFINSVFDNMQLYYFNYEELLFEEDDLADEVYFIRTGRVLIKAGEDIIIGVYPQGYYFGEIEVLDEISRICTASVFTRFAEIYTINKENYINILKTYEPIFEEVLKVAKLRREKYEKIILEALEEKMQKYNSLSTEFFFESSSDDGPTSELQRNDTGVMISFKNDTPFKQKNRLIWKRANGIRRGTRKDTKVKSFIEKRIKFASQHQEESEKKITFKKMIMMKRVPKEHLDYDSSFETLEEILENLGIQVDHRVENELKLRMDQDNPLVGIKKREFEFEDHVSPK